MMNAVGCEREVLVLPPLAGARASAAAADDSRDDPRTRRMRALGEKIAPLTFTGLPPAEALQGWWKRTGSEEAQRKYRKAYEHTIKERERGLRRGAMEQADQAEQEIAQKMYWIVIDELPV